MHVISSYHGNRPTHPSTHTNRHDRLQYTAPQLARSIQISCHSQSQSHSHISGSAYFSSVIGALPTVLRTIVVTMSLLKRDVEYATFIK